MQGFFQNVSLHAKTVLNLVSKMDTTLHSILLDFHIENFQRDICCGNS